MSELTPGDGDMESKPTKECSAKGTPLTAQIAQPHTAQIAQQITAEPRRRPDQPSRDQTVDPNDPRAIRYRSSLRCRALPGDTSSTSHSPSSRAMPARSSLGIKSMSDANRRPSRSQPSTHIKVEAAARKLDRRTYTRSSTCSASHPEVFTCSPTKRRLENSRTKTSTVSRSGNGRNSASESTSASRRITSASPTNPPYPRLTATASAAGSSPSPTASNRSANASRATRNGAQRDEPPACSSNAAVRYSRPPTRSCTASRLNSASLTTSTNRPSSDPSINVAMITASSSTRLDAVTVI